MALFRYSRAIVSGVASTLPAVSLRMADPSNHQPVDLEKARKQHEEYVKVLRGVVKEIHVIPPDIRYPDCVFVEDPVTVCHNTALLTKLGHENRRGEGVAMKKMVEELGLDIVEMKDAARMDGGDVLFTGKEFFVGLSKRTNKEGIEQLAAAFPSYNVTSVPVHQTLHLKSFLAMAGPELITYGGTWGGREARRIMERDGRYKYKFVEVPDDFGANCLYLNDTIVHTSRDPYPNSCEIFEKLETDAKKIAISISELHKVDGCFSCCSVLLE